MTNKCQAFELLIDDNYVSLVGGVVSVVSYLYLFYMYFVVKTPILKRHPTNLVVYKCFFEFIFVQQYIWLPFVDRQVWYEENQDTNSECKSSTMALLAAFVTQFSFLGAELAFLGISFDLRMAYTNPFSSFNSNRSKYFTTTVIIALVLAIILVTAPKAGKNIVGEAIEGTIWIRPFSSEENSLFEKVLFFYIWVLLIFLYSVWALWSLSSKMKLGYYKTLTSRLAIMKRAQTFVALYSLYWFIIMVLQIINFEAFKRRSDIDNRVFESLATMVLVLLSFRGFIMLLILVATNYDDFSFASLNPFQSIEFKNEQIANTIQEGILTNPNLNRALRAEVLYFTAQGIIVAARECRKHVDPSDSGRLLSSDRRTKTNNTPMSNMNSPIVQRNDSSDGDATFIVKDSMYRSTGDPSSVTNSESHRDTFSEIAKIEQQQGNIILKEQFKAIEREAKELGFYDELQDRQLRNSLHNINHVSMASENESVVAQQKTNASINNGLEMRSSIGAVEKHSQNTNPLHGSASSRSSLNKSDAKENEAAVTGSYQGLRASASSMRSSSGTKLEPIVEVRRSDGSDGSAVTDKWRETMDINYSIHPSNEKDQMASTRSRSSQASSNVDFKMASIDGRDKPTYKKENSVDGVRSRSSLVSDISQKLSGILKGTKNAFQSAFNDNERNKYDGQIVFKDHCPVLFAKLRYMSGISEEQYTKAFEDSSNLELSFKNSEGRSGAFFFYSLDKQYFVKSTTEQEINTLLRILPNYAKYLAVNKHSLINRFLGAHCITMYGQKIHFVVSKNVFGANNISERFDLKGSWVNRHSLNENKNNLQRRFDKGNASAESEASTPLFYDNDVQQKISLPIQKTITLAEQIFKDVGFLKGEGLMDYSLLVGIKKQRFEVVKKEPSPAPPPAPNAEISIPAHIPDRDMQAQTQGWSSTSQDPPSPNGRKKSMQASDFDSGHSNSRIPVVSSSLDQKRPSEIYAARSISGATASGSALSQKNSLVNEEIYSELRSNPFLQNEDGGIYAGIVDGPGFFYVGIIDILGEWTFMKKLEWFFKSYILRLDRDGISAQRPDRYADRFFDRCVTGLFDGLDSYSQDMMKKKKKNYAGSGFDRNRGYAGSLAGNRPSWITGPTRRSTLNQNSDGSRNQDRNGYAHSFDYTNKDRNSSFFDGRNSLHYLNDTEAGDGVYDSTSGLNPSMVSTSAPNTSIVESLEDGLGMSVISCSVSTTTPSLHYQRSSNSDRQLDV